MNKRKRVAIAKHRAKDRRRDAKKHQSGVPTARTAAAAVAARR